MTDIKLDVIFFTVFLTREASVCCMFSTGMTMPSYPVSSTVMPPPDNESPVQLQVGQTASSMGAVASHCLAEPLAHHLPIKAGSKYNNFQFRSKESCRVARQRRTSIKNHLPGDWNRKLQ